jgi:capsule polysaccharide export protein KpsE/RkpR
MTEELKAYIGQIRTRAHELHHSLVIERERNASLAAEIARLEGLLGERETNMSLLKSHADSLQQALEEQREQARQNEESAERSRDAEIDGLVKEIDFCIQQLRTAHE